MSLAVGDRLETLNGAQVYNEKIANNQPMEKRGPLVKQKQASFMELFKSDLEIVDIQFADERQSVPGIQKQL